MCVCHAKQQRRVQSQAPATQVRIIVRKVVRLTRKQSASPRQVHANKSKVLSEPTSLKHYACRVIKPQSVESTVPVTKSSPSVSKVARLPRKNLGRPLRTKPCHEIELSKQMHVPRNQTRRPSRPLCASLSRVLRLPRNRLPRKQPRRPIRTLRNNLCIQSAAPAMKTALPTASCPPV